VVLEALRCRCCRGDGHARVFATGRGQTFAVHVDVRAIGSSIAGAAPMRPCEQVKAFLASAGTAIVLLFLAAAVTAEAGLDYFIDAGDAIDALVRGDWTAFFANQPLMGGFSLFVRAPFVALVFHGSEATVYWAGSVPCVLGLLALCAWLLREMRRAGRSETERAMVGVALILSPLAVRALHWGHPEELLGAALCVGAVIAAARGRWMLAGLMLGCAIATKQWAVLAFLPALIATPARMRVRLVSATAIVALALTVPMFAGNPGRFMEIQRSVSDGPHRALGDAGGPSRPVSHVTPTNIFLPTSHEVDTDRGPIHVQDSRIGRVAHPLIILVALPLTLLLWRRRASAGAVELRDALLLLALLFLTRCVFDPMSLDYYHVPFLTALGAAGALGGIREARLALLATAGLALAFALPADSIYELSRYAVARNVVYLGVTLPLLWTLGRVLYGRAPGRAGELTLASRAATAVR
jgi:hypothetical protein